MGSISSLREKNWHHRTVIQLNALSLPDSVKLGEETYPGIDLLVVANRKDLDVFPLTVKSAILTSLNPIKSITVVTPRGDIEVFQQALEDLTLVSPWEVLDENLALNKEDRELIRARFPKRYGWVLQQFVAVSQVSASQALGVLLVNCDTVLTQRMHWLDNQGNQVLLASLEYHAPYYELLQSLSKMEGQPTYTFITHHMLFQPQILREILGLTPEFSTSDFFKLVLHTADTDEDSPLCVEFEPYAQGLLNSYSHKARLSKFSNLPLTRNVASLKHAEEAIDLGKKFPYKSISLHSYLK